jgi:membrane protein YqaA with SNARE-associated domain
MEGSLLLDSIAWVSTYGLFGLAVMAFLAATLVPFSSEIAVVAALQFGFPAPKVLLWASLGNSLGALSNYGLGRLLTPATLLRLEQQAWGQAAYTWAQRYGGWSLAASWMPLLGDPLMLLSGVLRLPLPYVIFLGLGTRVARYALLVSFFAP